MAGCLWLSQGLERSRACRPPAEAWSEFLAPGALPAAEPWLSPFHPGMAAGPGCPVAQLRPTGPPQPHCPPEPSRAPSRPWGAAPSSLRSHSKERARAAGPEAAGLTVAGRTVTPWRQPAAGRALPSLAAPRAGGGFKTAGAEPALPPPSHWLQGTGRRGWGTTAPKGSAYCAPGARHGTGPPRAPPDPEESQGPPGPPAAPGPSEPSGGPHGPSGPPTSLGPGYQGSQHPWDV